MAPTIAAMVEPCAPAVFRQLAPMPPTTGVMAIARRSRVEVADLLGLSPEPVVLLERPQHLGNVGAAVRVAAAAGAAGLVTLGGLDPWHPTAVRSAAGLQYALPCLRLDALPPTARPLVIVDPSGEPIGTRALPSAALLVFGTEREGVGPELRARAAHVLALPMRPGVSSLNLATAVAATLYLLAHLSPEPRAGRGSSASAEPSPPGDVRATNPERETSMSDEPLDPSLTYASPKALADDPKLGRSEKIRLLVRWRLDARRLQESEGEGMIGGERAPLGEIERLIAELETAD
jgi:TrmH family RNA methyltransferase